MGRDLEILNSIAEIIPSATPIKSVGFLPIRSLILPYNCCEKSTKCKDRKYHPYVNCHIGFARPRCWFERLNHGIYVRENGSPRGGLSEAEESFASDKLEECNPFYVY